MRLFLVFLIILLLSNIRISAEFNANPVKVKLITDQTTAVYDNMFNIGVLFEIESGWHIYWKYPGDSGLPTEITYSLPDEIIIGETLYPIPEIYPREGNITDYGYEREVLLVNKITVPKKYNKQYLDISAEIYWVACKEICIPGKEKSDINIMFSNKVKKANKEVFAKWKDRIPSYLDDMNLPFTYIVNKDYLQDKEISEISLQFNWHDKVKDVTIYPKLDRFINFDYKELNHSEQNTFYKFIPKFYNKDVHDIDTLEILISYFDTKDNRIVIETELKL